MPIPSTWRCIVAIPDGAPGISGAGEAETFARLPAPPERDVERVAHVVLMALLPALADADLGIRSCAEARCRRLPDDGCVECKAEQFAPGAAVNDAAPGRMGRVRRWPDSWGPAVYGIVEGDEAMRRLADRVSDALRPSGTVFAGPFRSDGARVWRAAVHATR